LSAVVDCLIIQTSKLLENMAHQSADRQFAIHVAGALHVDEVATVQGNCVPQASNPVSWQRSVGGVGSNAARAAQQVLSNMNKGAVCLHAAVGSDHTGRQLMATIASQGLHVAAQPVRDASTGRYSAIISESGELVLGLADVELAEQLQAAPILSLLQQDRLDAVLLDANLSTDCLYELTTAAAERRTPLAAMTVSPVKALKLLPIAKQIPLVFCNRREAAAMAVKSGLIEYSPDLSQPTITRLMEALVAMGFNDCVLTDAGGPLVVRYQGKNSIVPISTATVVRNVNGAGDALAGASFAAMVAGCPLPEAVEAYGLARAALVLGEDSQLALRPID